ncbi:cytosolic sulfotransferase [Salix suchowensis]|nr:cytosolic sulfotransferase [Salix suchowensis]
METTTISTNRENVPTDEIQGLVAGFPSEENWDGSPLYFYKGVWYPAFAIRGAISFQQHFIARDTDIILASMPKSGTTWLKALAFSVVNRNIYSPTESPLLTTPPHDLVRFFEMDLYSKSQLPDLEHLPAPRIFSSHMNPLDQLVSYFHFVRKFKRENVKPLTSIDEGFDNICRGIQSYGPFWDSVLGYWKASLERPDKKEGVIQEISKLCSFDNLRNLEVNRTSVHPLGPLNSVFFRKAKVGDWCNDLTPSMAERFLKIVEEKLADSGLSFKVSE